MPEWTVDAYAYAVFPANDGEHLVRIDNASLMLASFVGGKRLPADEERKQIDGPGLTVMKRNAIVKSYAVRELTERPDSLPHSPTHVLWIAGGVVTADGRRFVLMTQDSLQVVIELATGDIVSKKEAGLGNVQTWVLRVLMALVLAFVVAFVVRGLVWGRART